MLSLQASFDLDTSLMHALAQIVAWQQYQSRFQDNQ